VFISVIQFKKIGVKDAISHTAAKSGYSLWPPCVADADIIFLPPIFGRAAITLGIGPHSSIPFMCAASAMSDPRLPSQPQNRHRILTGSK